MGAVSAFSADSETGGLRFLNRKPAMGTDPCYVTVDKTGRYVLAANFMSGSVCILPVQEDGSLGDASDFIQHQGSSVNPKRQEGPHAHACVLDRANRYVLVPDLGIDKIMIYKFDSNSGRLEPNNDPWFQVRAGSGPRHLAFHPNGRYAYLINELNSTLTVFSYNENNGTLKEVQTVSTLPDDFAGANTGADINVHPSGKFVYASNRGLNDIVIYAINESTGKLTYVGRKQTQGKTPRNFAIDPTGRFLFAANQDTDSIVTFRIDQQTGELLLTGHIKKVPTPVCIKMIFL